VALLQESNTPPPGVETPRAARDEDVDFSEQLVLEIEAEEGAEGCKGGWR
jgi:hypothetical protein